MFVLLNKGCHFSVVCTTFSKTMRAKFRQTFLIMVTKQLYTHSMLVPLFHIIKASLGTISELICSFPLEFVQDMFTAHNFVQIPKQRRKSILKESLIKASLFLLHNTSACCPFVFMKCWSSDQISSAWHWLWQKEEITLLRHSNTPLSYLVCQELSQWDFYWITGANLEELQWQFLDWVLEI